MPDYTPAQIERAFRGREDDMMANAARNHPDIHLAAAPDFAPAIRKSFVYDPSTDTLKRREGVPETVTIASIINEARATHPHRFRTAAAAAEQQQPAPGGAGRFGGFAAGTTAGDDFFRLSPDEKIRIGSEKTRPNGY